jgi:hypothetical protein
MLEGELNDGASLELICEGAAAVEIGSSSVHGAVMVTVTVPWEDEPGILL